MDKYLVRKLEKEQREFLYFQYLDISGLGEQIALIVLDEIISYLDMENTITLCKKCAFVEDKTNLVLCTICKKRYHKKGYKCCTECGAENRNF